MSISTHVSPVNGSSLTFSYQTSQNLTEKQPESTPYSLFFRSFIVDHLQRVAIANILLAVLIIAANVLLLVVLLSKPSLRNGLRNHLLISLVMSNLIVGILGCPFEAERAARWEWLHDCQFHIAQFVLTIYFQNCVTMWGMVLLLINYLCRLKSYCGPAVLQRLPTWVQSRVAPLLFVLLPWFAAVLLTSSLMSVASLNEGYPCPIHLNNLGFILMSVFSFSIPGVLMLILVVAIIVVTKRNRMSKGRGSRTVQEDFDSVPRLDDRRSESLESPWVHVTAALMCLITMLGEETLKFYFREDTEVLIHVTLMIVETSLSLSEFVMFVLPILWLLGLRDVRARARELLTVLRAVTPCSTGSPDETSGGPGTSVTFKNLRDDD